MALTAFDALGGIITNLAPMACGLHALAVQHRRRGLATLALRFPDEGAQRVVERGPQMIERPAPENMINGLPRGKIRGQITPRNATFDDIEDGIQDASQIGGWPTVFSTFGQHRFKVFPLGVGEAGVVYGVFHALTEAALKIGLASAKPNVNHSLHIVMAKPHESEFSDSQSGRW